MNILILNGPNLNMLGIREPEVYGKESLEDIRTNIQELADRKAFSFEFFQSNAEHEIVEKIQSALGKFDSIVFNPGAFTHTSVAIRDALLAVSIPFYEVHISNVFAREEFRKKSYFSDIAVAVISGCGSQGYELAIRNSIKE
ncbi:MAG: type II 3-dehydroquinate dehydratase [Gammaproteobacteria bacterium]|jgi:3-dehydroquinate dehydratase-2